MTTETLEPTEFMGTIIGLSSAYKAEEDYTYWLLEVRSGDKLGELYVAEQLVDKVKDFYLTCHEKQKYDFISCRQNPSQSVNNNDNPPVLVSIELCKPIIPTEDALARSIDHFQV